MVSNLDKLTMHSYLSKSQSKYLKKRKDLNQETIIFLGDFAENFKFIVQD